VVTQNPYGQGGVLLTDKKYKNFELYIEVKIDSFTNGGIFTRSTESGVAYQIELDEIAGSTGSLYGSGGLLTAHVVRHVRDANTRCYAFHEGSDRQLAARLEDDGNAKRIICLAVDPHGYETKAHFADDIDRTAHVIEGVNRVEANGMHRSPPCVG
jgi:hypothetical protein